MKYLNQAKLYSRQYRDEANDLPDGGKANGEELQEGQKNQEADPAKLMAELETLRKEKESLLNKNNELLGESKKFKEASRQAQKQAEDEALKKAEAEGNYKQLYESSQQSSQQANEKLTKFVTKVAKTTEKSVAMRLAMKMEALSDSAAEDLAMNHVAKRLKFVDNDNKLIDSEGDMSPNELEKMVKVVDESGNLTVATFDDLVKEMQASGRYSFYLKGNQSAGGGAEGSRGSASKVKQITRSQFDGMSQKQRSEYSKSGGSIIND